MQYSAHILRKLICKQVCFSLAFISPSHRLTNDPMKIEKPIFERKKFFTSRKVVKRLNKKINCLFIIDKQFLFSSPCASQPRFFLLKLDFHFHPSPEATAINGRGKKEEDFIISCHVNFCYICHELLGCDFFDFPQSGNTYAHNVLVRWIVNAFLCHIKSTKMISDNGNMELRMFFLVVKIGRFENIGFLCIFHCEVND